MTPPPLTFTRYANAFSKYGTDSALETVVGDIRTGAWAQQVAAVRQAVGNGGKDAGKPFKKLLPAVTFSGRFNVRKTSGLIAHSGLICADLDALGDRLATVRAAVGGDPHTVAAFTSPSGDGLKVVFRCDPARPHLQSFHAARAHILAITGEAVDEACKNVDRLCFVSHDPDAFLADTPAEVPVLPYPATVTEDASGIGVMPDAFEDEAGLSTGDLAELLRSIPPRPDYDKWLRIASAVWSVTDEATGCALLTAWSPEGEPGEYAAKHPHRLADVGVGTLIYYAKATGWKPSLAFKAKLPEILSPDAAPSPVYFDGQSYWRKEDDGNFGRIGREDAKLELKAQGLSARVAKGAASELSQVDAALHAIQKENRVTYAAPFCGRPAGHYNENGIAVLATSSPQIITPGLGDLTPLEDFFRDLFGRGRDPHADTQFEAFVGWLQRWRRALQNPAQHLPGQALFLIGPKDCGKTLAQTLLTRLSGGRSADPSLWLFGRSDFNGELWGAEHLAMSDANVEDSYAARRALRDSVKQVVANPDHTCHRKHRDAVTLRAIWRLTVSANPDADSSTIIPPLDESSRDKVLYLKCYAPPVPFPTTTEAGADAFFKRLIEAAPAFLTAVEGFELPEALRGSRFGVKEFHHPDIAEELAGVHPDADAADLIDAWLAGHPEKETSGTAAELFGRIEAGHHPSVVWTRAVRSATALGQLLRRLSHVPGWSERIAEETIRVGANRVQRTVWTLRKNAQKNALKKAA